MRDIELRNVALTIEQRGSMTAILDNASLVVPRQRMALVGSTRANTVAVLDLLCRRLVPQKGQIIYRGRVSWPLGHPGPFSVAVTGTQAISHFSILYGIERELAVAFMVEEFQRPDLLNTAISNWPRSLQHQFMLLMALIPSFDIYLIDANIVFEDDPAFTRRFLQLFNTRIADRTALFTVRQAQVIRQMCTAALVVDNGSIRYTDDVEAAIRLGNRRVPDVEDVLSMKAEEQMEQDDFLL